MPGRMKCIAEMEQSLAIDPAEGCACSGKTGIGVETLLRRSSIVFRRPNGDPEAPLQAMVFDSHYDEFRGAITYVHMMNGTVRKGQKIRFLRGGTSHEVLELGQFVPHRRPCEDLQAGQVGYLICNIRSLGQVHIGDTVSDARRRRGRATARLPGAKRMVFCGLYPSDGQDFEELRNALNKLQHQRPQFQIRAGNQRRLGLRLPLRISGSAAHGDYPAAAGAGGQPRPGADRA